MFFYSIIIAIVIGYAMKGRLKNIGNVKFDWLYLVVIGFCIDISMQLMGKYGVLKINYITFVADLIMYILIFAFVYKNKKSYSVLLIGLGSLLNAIAIFSNGGAMPVRQSAMDSIVKDYNPLKGGLYVIMHNNSNFKSLSDTMYIKFFGPYIFSIGDIIVSIGIMIIIMMGMITTSKATHRINNRGKRIRRSERIKKSVENVL